MVCRNSVGHIDVIFVGLARALSSHTPTLSLLSLLLLCRQVERTKTERRVLEVCDGHPFIMAMFYAFQVF